MPVRSPPSIALEPKSQEKKPHHMGRIELSFWAENLKRKTTKTYSTTRALLYLYSSTFHFLEWPKKEIYSETKEPNFALMIDTVINYGKAQKK